MADGTQLSMTNDGRLAVTKRAANGPGADRLRREADILRGAAHPGVVELFGIVDLEGGVVLHTAFVGGGTLAEQIVPPDRTTSSGATKAPDAVRGAQVAAALAATLADLHDRGIVHQRVTADHVLVTDVDQVRLCGFAGAAMSREADSCDPEAAAADVVAVACVVEDIAGAATGAGGEALRAVADRVLRADPSARPTMRTLAQALAALADGEAGSTPPVAQGRKLLPARPSAATRRRRPTNRQTAVALLTVVAVLVTSAVVATTVAGPGPSSPSVAPSPMPVAPAVAQRSTTTVAVTPSVSTPPTGVRVWPRDPGPTPDLEGEDCPSPATPATVDTAGTADIDGDGCAEVVAVADGVVSVLGRRWQVASPDDLVVVGDWNCDGVSTPAVVRPDTGDVWTFPHWAEEDEEVSASAKETTTPGVIAAVAIAASGDEPGCHNLELTHATGKTTRLSLNAQRG
jgi:hypothetical protein